MQPVPGPATRGRIRWGLPDAAWAWVAGLVASLFALPLAEPDTSTSDQPVRFILAALLLQNLGVVLTLIVVAKRKGRGSLGADFGLVWPFDRMRAPAVLGWLAAGAAWSLAAQALLAPIVRLADLDEAAQEISKTVERTGGVGLGFLLFSVVLVAPVVEELLFRGALLRALQRRTSVPVAVFVSATIFAAIHLTDPGSYYVVPGLLLLGLVSGWQAARTGDLSRSVLLHMGFNLLSAVALVAA